MKKAILLLFVFAHLFSFGQRNKLEDFITNIYYVNGDTIVEVVVPGSPPPDVLMPVSSPDRSAVMLSNVPAFNWCYGCSATSGAIMAGYYDNNSYPDMYTGPANGGLVPMNNNIWGYGECPLSATHQGYDGLTERGHVDDFWVSVYSGQPDPYITGGWTPHGYENCTADFMGTNQSALGNNDGSTAFYYNPSGAKLYDFQAPSGHKDGCAGFRDFLESRGYDMVENYTQLIPNAFGNASGFTFNNYKTQIDAGRPVMIHVMGHSMVGLGYNETGEIIYLHDTWDHSLHQMTWGGSYSGMDQWGVSVFQLEPPPLDVQQIGLPNGWSGISSYIVPETNDLESMFQDIIDDIVIIQNASGVFWPEQNINTIGTWDTHEGYQIKMAGAVDLTISGFIESNKTLLLVEGWNLIAVLSDCAVNVSDLFLGKDVIIVKEVAGPDIYWPGFGINTLDTLQPGKSYIVLMGSEESIVFPECP
ncbi:MAG: hypothetical protein B6I19_08795 [Bacteroidetes bacterium 4572_114]|nr:MAG: hypothetical protein B6I19_08795 [Bacteroidetes bacterium 4572_114]